MFETHTDTTIEQSLIQLTSNMSICQSDYPLDWYQQDFVPYAEEFQALPNRKLTTIIDWMTPYVTAAKDHFGDSLMLVAHYYMGGEIVKLIEQFGGEIGDSYQLALKAVMQPEKKIIIESAVHFMAESISILANQDQQVYITNPKSGCTMEMLAKDFMVQPALNDLNERYGRDNILPVCYMNTSGRVKALTGAQGGAVCTSSNVKQIFEWAREKKKKIVFIPDRHMGENVADWLHIPTERLAYWPSGNASAQFNLFEQDSQALKRFDESEIVLFDSHCAVHTHYQPEMVHYWQERGYATIAHPECRNSVVKVADSYGSTAKIWSYVMNDEAKTQKYAVATENHMVENIKQQAALKGITVVSVADAAIENKKSVGCGCATMSRNDPPHLVALLDLLRKGCDVSYNLVKPGDVVNEFTGTRQRLNDTDQAWVTANAKKALQQMITITES